MPSKSALNQHAAAFPATPVTPIPGPYVGHMIMSYLQLEGVTHVFGIPGGGLLYFLDDLKENDQTINYIVSRHETGAAYMADGYFRATGKLGVVVVTTGPGATNALTGMMNAQADGSAVMLISGEVAQNYYGMGYLQEGEDVGLDLDGVYRNAVGYSSYITAGSDAQTIMKQALRSAWALPRQAVYLSLPVNVTLQTLPSGAVLPTSTQAYRTDAHSSSPADAKIALESMLKCERPVFFIGNGCRQALRNPDTLAKFTRIVETYGIPVITTVDGKGIFPESHDLSLRHFGIASCMWPSYYLTAAAPEKPFDGIMVIGSQMGALSTEHYLPMLMPKVAGSPFIQVDILQTMIGRCYPVTQGIVSEAEAFINDMHSLIEQYPPNQKSVDERKREVASIKMNNSPFVSMEQFHSTVAPAEPAASMGALQNLLPPDTKIFVDAGNCVGWASHYMTISPPMEMFTCLSMGPMGFAVGAVIGAKIGLPTTTCIAITGDGAFLMHGAEISTAKQNNVGAIWIVLNDNNLNMVSQGMQEYIPDTANPTAWFDLYGLGNPDLMAYSKSLGADAYEVNKPGDFAAIMPKVLEGANVRNTPQVVVININTTSVTPYYNPVYFAGPPAVPAGF